MEIQEKEPYWLGHRERLRLQAEEKGVSALKSREMVELILYYAVPRQDTSDIARRLIERFGTLGALFDAGPDELTAVEGVTPAMASWIMMTGEIIHAYSDIDSGDMLRLFRFSDVMRLLGPMADGVRPPESRMLFTDFEDNLITYTVMCDSLSWWEPEYVRQCVMDAIALQARHAVLVLFMGRLPLELEPCELEHLLALSRTLRGADVELLDCVLVGDGDMVSLNHEGRMDAVRQEAVSLSVHERYAQDDGDDGGEAPVLR